MRIRTVEVTGFRAFSGTNRFDLDGDVVLVVGANGQGKTSLFDAIHWAFAGEISRLNQPDSVVSLYSDSGEARVQVTASDSDGRSLVVTRHSDGQRSNLLVEDGDSVFRGQDAEHELLRSLWPEGLAASDSQEALRSALERGVYLQQDVLTDFLTADTDQERFNSIAELIGSGQTTELQEALERSRVAWSRATNQQSSEAEQCEARLSDLKAQQRQLFEAGPGMKLSGDEWDAWWTRAGHLGVAFVDLPNVSAPDAQQKIDGAMAEMRAIRLSRERRGENLQGLTLALLELPAVDLDLPALVRASEGATQALEAGRDALAGVEARAAETARRQLELRSQEQELRVLAEIALRHLGERCPVCEQTYDRDHVIERLNSLTRSTDVVEIEQAGLPDVAQVARRVEELEKAQSAAATMLRHARREERMRVEGLERIRAGLDGLAVEVQEDGDIALAIKTAQEENARSLQDLDLAAAEGEALALSLARAGHAARRTEIGEEIQQLERELAALNEDVEARQGTRELASRMIESLREASSGLVRAELARLEPLLQRIYATADPHPEFRVVRLLSRMSRGRGRLLAEVEDPVHGHQNVEPSAFLSSSQVNVLALSVFLALNLGVPTLPLQVAILDDPLQSVDDLNLLGLVDILKRTRERRQLMISTHDARFASLLERKLRPVAASQRTIVVELRGWSSEGPVTAQHDVERDRTPIRIAAA